MTTATSCSAPHLGVGKVPRGRAVVPDVSERTHGRETAAPGTAGADPLGPGGVVHDVVVVGAGQAGLSAAYHLRRAGLDPVVLDGGVAPAARGRTAGTR